MIEIKYITFDSIAPYDNNPRENYHTVESLVKSIPMYGFTNPLVLDGRHTIIAGHARYYAAKELGLEKVPCIVLDDISKDDAKQYRLIDNKTQELGIDDMDIAMKEASTLSSDFLDIFNGEVKAPALIDTKDEQLECMCPFCLHEFTTKLDI